MPDAAERFIAAATRRFADNPELQIAAERELRGLMERAGPASRAPSPGDGTEQLPEEPAKQRARTLLIMAAALISLLILAFTAHHVFSRRQVFVHWLNLDSFYYGELSPSLIAPRASAEERMILFGDSSKNGIVAQMQALWERHPQNPAYFREYALAHWKEHKTLPPGFLETAEQISPGNAYFTLLAASMIAKDSVDPLRSFKRVKGGHSNYEWHIKDPSKATHVMTLLEEALSMPDWEPYQNELLRERFALIPASRDGSDRAILNYYMGNSHLTEPLLSDLGWVIAASAVRCEKERDRAGFDALLRIWKDLFPKLVERESPSFFQGLCDSSTLSLVAKEFRKGCLSLGLHHEAASLENQIHLLEELEGMRRNPNPRNAAFAKEMSCRGGHLANIYSIMENYRPENGLAPHTARDLKPGRLADYELASRVGALIGCSVFAIAAVLPSIYRFRGSLLARRLSGSLPVRFERRDWIWLLGGGVAAPFLTLEILARLTPLGGRDWSVTTHGLIVTTGQLLATVVLMLGLPLMIARWRLGKRAVILGFNGRRQWVAKSAMALCFLALLLFGIGFLSNNPAEYSGRSDFVDLDITEDTGDRWKTFLAATIAVGIGLSWWLLTGARALFSSGEQILRRIVISRLLVPAYVFAMFLMALAMPAYHAAEKYWISRDKLMETTAETLPFDRYNHEIATSYQARLVEILTSSKPAP